MLLHGDCLAILPTLDAESIDAILTDPPYGLGFMGKAWDHGVPGVPFWTAMLRVAKPGAHLLAFGGTRTVHRIATAIEDAGWEIRDTLVWAYASGFPKSLDVSKAIDKAAGAERRLTRPGEVIRGGLGEDWDVNGSDKRPRYDEPATPDAEKWQGWGTALKPAWEPIVLARKPLRGTVAANVLAHGTGALNIDGTRILGAKGPGHWGGKSPGRSKYGGDVYRASATETDTEQNPLGRWPANVILTDPIFDGDTPGVVGGGETGPAGTAGPGSGDWGRWLADGEANGSAMTYGDAGTYSRFFLIPKAARRDREPKGHTGEDRLNTHPTVKPTALMRHLVRLVTPPGGLVLDPFLGSGTTALAAEAEGFAWIGIEREAEYIAIAEARLNATQRSLGLAG